ncbi:MAG: SMC-Scp complex subunit ScpB [Candidatus Paceibacterota bacterium]|jgi:segregation and condensation protein B
MNIEQKIEAILFWKGEPLSRKKLSEILDVSSEDIEEGIDKLKAILIDRGIVLQENDKEIALGTTPELSSLFEKLQKEELNKDLSKASLETLSIILYKNGASRAEIDYIRGVNSSFILRALSVRGLIQRETDMSDNRRYIYKPTFDLLSYLGVKSVEELPNYKKTLQLLMDADRNLEEEKKDKDLEDTSIIE